ncbi:MAG: hypothetical protein AB1589_43835 [Cyanobacteriota bacterium]
MAIAYSPDARAGLRPASLTLSGMKTAIAKRIAYPSGTPLANGMLCSSTMLRKRLERVYERQRCRLRQIAH